jgi:hypothetical protein
MLNFIIDAVNRIADSKTLARIEDKVLAKFEQMQSKPIPAHSCPIEEELVASGPKVEEKL